VCEPVSTGNSSTVRFACQESGVSLSVSIVIYHNFKVYRPFARGSGTGLLLINEMVKLHESQRAISVQFTIETRAVGGLRRLTTRAPDCANKPISRCDAA
jgi:hypothetical protein